MKWGRLTDVRFFPRALGSAEVKRLAERKHYHSYEVLRVDGKLFFFDTLEDAFAACGDKYDKVTWVEDGGRLFLGCDGEWEYDTTKRST